MIEKQWREIQVYTVQWKILKTSPALKTIPSFYFRDLVVLFLGDGLLTGDLKLRRKSLEIIFRKTPL